MTPGGTITQKDIITDDALKVGDLYVAQMEKMIGANKLFAASILEYGQNLNNIRKVENNQQFLTEKQKEIVLFTQAKNAIELQKNEEIALEKIKQEAIKTEKARQEAETQSQKAKQATVKLTVEERVKNEINNKILKQEALERLGLVSAYTKLNNERTKAKNILRDLIATEGSSTAEIKKARIEFELLDKKVKLADRSVGDFTKNVGNYKSAFASISSIGKGLISAFGITTGAAAVGALFKDAFESMKQFEQGVADLSSITGASGKDLEYLKNQAIDLGRSTKGGAIQVLEAYKLIASAKPELLDNVKDLNSVTEAVLTLSKASGLDLPDAATRLTDAMNQFGAPASEAGKYIDVLAAGAKYGAAEIPGITDALLKFGAVAKVSNVSIQESVGLVELLAEKGLKGAEAGTAIKNILLEVNSGFTTNEARAELDKYGISFETLKDKTIPFADKLELLKPLLSDTNSIISTFKKENSAAAISLIENTDRLKELTGQVDEYGVALEQANISTDTLQGDTDKLSSTYDSLILSVGKGSGVISKFFRLFTQGATELLNDLIRINTSWDEIMDKAKDEGTKNGEKLYDERFNFLKGTGDELEVSKSIAKAAQKEAESIAKQLNDQRKKLEDLAKKSGLEGESLTSFVNRGYGRDTEELKRKLAEQNAIVAKHNKKMQDSRIKVDPNETNITGVPPAGETDAQKAKRLAAAKKAAKDKYDLEKQLADSLYELQKQRLEQTIKFNDEILKDDEQSDEVRIQAALNNQQKQFELLLLTKNHLLDNDKLTANDRIRIEEDYSAKKIDISKKTAIEIDKINEFDLAKYQAELDAKVKVEQIKGNELESIENDRFKNELVLLGDNQKAIEDATKEHEKKLWQIKHDGALAIAKIQFDSLQTELDAFKKQSDGSEKSTKIIADLELKLSEYKKRLTELGLENFKESKKEEVKGTKEKTEEILEMSNQMLGDLANLSNAFTEGKIAKIDDEIAKNNEYYDKQIELAGRDEKQKDLLEKDRQKKNAILEKKKADEKNKQAKIDKAVTIAQIAIQTALAIIKAAPNPALVTFASITGAIALATAIATPIPKYKDGRKDGPAEIAMINDGGVQEFITDSTGGNVRTTTKKNAIVPLLKHDIVHKSKEDYERYIRNALLNNVINQGEKMNAYQQSVIYDVYRGEMLSEMKKNTEAIKNQKQNITINTPKFDINHHLWKMKNTNWN